MSSLSDATPAYRGYRLQALYTLFRILSQKDNENFVFQPEGYEDLAIFDVDENLLEVIQVKSHNKLTLSSFNPKSEFSFFYRIKPLLEMEHPPEINIVSFGEIGPLLHQAIGSEGDKQEREAIKLSNYGHIKKDDAKYILNNLDLITLDDTEITESVYVLLRNALTGIDADSAFDLLSFWLYICAENKYKITKADVTKKIKNIGKFFAERVADHKEWFTSIVPIDDYDIDAEELDWLSSEFYQGISARYDHILADIDVFRPHKIQEIDAKFRESPVVIIHGASGQGKTTLAYRYLHDFFPNLWRFRIELIESRRHALSIARALIGHADAIGMPIAIYIDVSAKDSDWPELIKQLSFHKNIRILVTIREEDFNRASIPDYEIHFSDIDLTFNKSEAEEIYKSLAEMRTPSEFLNFDEAWDKFGGEGPLMEFVHLVTQGESLRRRLKQQVSRLEDGAREKGIKNNGEIELLRLVSLASAFDAQLEVKPLINHLNLEAPRRTLELFEKEYMLRLSTDGSLVGGLHPIRSEMLADILTDSVISPWSESARACLPLIHVTDIENFLLHAFSRRPEDIEPLLDALNSCQPGQWHAIAGITRALLWLGILEYVEESRELIKDAFEYSGVGFVSLLDSDISDAMQGIAGSSLNIFSDLGLINEGKHREIELLRSRQTDKTQVFTWAKTWFSNRTQRPEPPQWDEDWSGMAETLFWLGHLNISWPLSEWLPITELERSIEELPLEILADLVLGLHCGHGDLFATWLESIRSRLLNRFREETQTVSLQDDEKKVNAHFIINFEQLSDPKFGDQNAQASGDYLHDEAMRRIKLLRRLLPDREAYACQGYGHRLWNEELPIDDTQKNGIPKSQLPPIWLTSINSTFRGLAEQPYRPITWEEYAKSNFELRENVFNAMKKLEKGLKSYFRKQMPDQLFGKLINVDEWDQYHQMLVKPPLVPSCALDEWGFIDEFSQHLITQNNKDSEEHIFARGPVLQKHKPFLTSFEKYTQNLSNFFGRSSHAMVLNSIRGKGLKNRSRIAKSEKNAIQRGIKPEFIRLSTINLAEAVKILPTFQRRFRQTLGQFFDTSDLDDLEKREQITFNLVWGMWYFFSTQPNQTYRKPEIEYPKKIHNKIKIIHRNIQRDLSIISSKDIHIYIASSDIFWDDKPALWILIDGKNAVEVYNSVGSIFPIILKSINELDDIDLNRLVFGFTWPSIVVVPIVRGKCLDDKAWRVNSDVLLLGENSGKLSWWNLVIRYPIPRDAFNGLNLDIWDDPQLEVAANLAQSAFELSLRLASIRDFKRLPELDEQGFNQFNTYLQSLMDNVSIVCQSVLDSGAEMTNIVGELPNSELENPPYMIESMNALVEMGKYITPVDEVRGEITLDLKTIFKWADMLEKARVFAVLAYLFWASDVISDIHSAN